MLSYEEFTFTRYTLYLATAFFGTELDPGRTRFQA